MGLRKRETLEQEEKGREAEGRGYEEREGGHMGQDASGGCWDGWCEWDVCRSILGERECRVRPVDNGEEGAAGLWAGAASEQRAGWICAGLWPWGPSRYIAARGLPVKLLELQPQALVQASLRRQLLGSPLRGWSWVRAALAPWVHSCGSPSSASQLHPTGHWPDSQLGALGLREQPGPAGCLTLVGTQPWGGTFLLSPGCLL